MKKIIILHISILCCFCSCKLSTAEKQSKPQAGIPEAIDRNAYTLLEDSLINALSIGVYYKGKSALQHYGELDPGQHNKPTDKTLYEIASVSKTLVGTLIAKAEIEGKFSIEDDIRTYMQSSYPNLAYEDQPIRIKHLMTHTSRLPRFLPERINELFEEINEELPFKIAKIQNAYSKEQFLEDLQHIVIDTIPGTSFAYSNADTELAAYILEQVYEDSFDNILEKYFAQEVGMPNTRIRLQADQEKFRANGYGSDRKPTPFMATKLWGAGGAAKSTLPDLMKYIQFQLDEENPIVKKTHEVLYDEEVIFGDEDNKLGYFWILNKDPELGTYYSHHGGAFGTQNWIFIYPEADLGISILTNQGDWQTAGKLLHVVEQLLEYIKENP